MNNNTINNGRSSHGSWSGGQDIAAATVEPPTAEEVIEKIKDDGDFDRLRRKIINKLRSNESLTEAHNCMRRKCRRAVTLNYKRTMEALKSNICSAVKQSKALTVTGASRNVKPRQLLDIIHQEIGTELMGQMSDAVWGVIRSKEEMGREISETVETVYNKMVNERRKAQETEGAPSSHSPALTDQQPNGRGPSSSPLSLAACDQQSAGKEPNSSPSPMATHEQQATGKQPSSSLPVSDDSSASGPERRKASVLSLTKQDQPYNLEVVENSDRPCSSHGVRISSDAQPSELAGFAHQHVQSQQVDDNDLDPEVPPGFG